MGWGNNAEKYGWDKVSMTATTSSTPLGGLWALLFASPRRALTLLGLGSAGVLSAAFFFQFVLGYQPCILCLYQRWPFAAVIVVALAAQWVKAWPGAVDALLVVAGLALLANSGIAFFHVGVEQHWWEGTAACVGGGALKGDDLDALRAQIMAAPVVRCDQIPWSLFGISMAGYNVVLSLGMSAYAFIAGRIAYTAGNA